MFAMIVKSREFEKTDEGFNVKETRDLNYDVKPQEALTNLKNLYAEIEKLKNYYKRIVVSVSEKVDQYNTDLKVFKDASGQLELELELPDYAELSEELNELNAEEDDVQFYRDQIE